MTATISPDVSKSSGATKGTMGRFRSEAVVDLRELIAGGEDRLAGLALAPDDGDHLARRLEVVGRHEGDNGALPIGSRRRPPGADRRGRRSPCRSRPCPG